MGLLTFSPATHKQLILENRFSDPPLPPAPLLFCTPSPYKFNNNSFFIFQKSEPFRTEGLQLKPSDPQGYIYLYLYIYIYIYTYTYIYIYIYTYTYIYIYIYIYIYTCICISMYVCINKKYIYIYISIYTYIYMCIYICISCSFSQSVWST